MARKNINTTIDSELYSKLQILALKLSAEKEKRINTNDLLEEAIQELLKKYKYLTI